MRFSGWRRTTEPDPPFEQVRPLFTRWLRAWEAAERQLRYRRALERRANPPSDPGPRPNEDAPAA